jgi:hypothetical protein
MLQSTSRVFCRIRILRPRQLLENARDNANLVLQASGLRPSGKDVLQDNRSTLTSSSRTAALSLVQPRRYLLRHAKVVGVGGKC